MRALRYDRYGSPDALKIEDVPEPTPRAGQAKVRVHAASLNPLDWKIRAGHMRFVPMFRPPPRGSGSDFAGEIVAVGGGATARHVGERVFGSIIPFGRDGAIADFVVVDYERISPIEDGVDFAQASTLPVAGGTAMQGLVDETRVSVGQRVLITGAAGGVGHFAVQIAKHLDAYVVAVCGSGNIDFVRALGADEVVDYTKDDFTRRDERFDVVFDAAGASSFIASRGLLNEAGSYINTGGDTAAFVTTAVGGVVARFTSRQRAIAIVLRNAATNWARLMPLVRSGVVKPHTARTIAMDEATEAYRSMETGHARGKIVVRVA
jgi:NADPH:quinone reductase-like Zn-dependent oxidoreductase